MTHHVGTRVSVIIPARNEQGNIARVVRSVAAQEGIREILVVDDHSDDRTGEILEALETEIRGLRTIRVEALPEGWLGKTHAAATGARAASGEWLLFTDADTEHLPGSLTTLLRHAENAKVELLSVSPGQVTNKWWEKSLIPLVYVYLARLFRFEDVGNQRSTAAAANGQYILIRRQAYERAGGHEAVRSEILEDVELARRVKASGGRLLFMPGGEWVRTRMYASLSEMWRGWTKNLYLLYERRIGRILRTLGEALALDLLPPLVFVALLLAAALDQGSATILALGVGCLLFGILWHWRRESYLRALERVGFDRRLASYRIPGAMLFSLLLVSSLWAHRISGKIDWKGRTYLTGKTAWFM